MRLSATERRRVGGLFDAILTPGTNARLPLGGSEAGLVDFFEEQLTFLPLRTRLSLRAAVNLLAVALPLHPRGVGAALDQLADSRFYPLREAVTLLKSVVCMGYFTHPEVRREMGLDLRLETPR